MQSPRYLHERRLRHIKGGMRPGTRNPSRSEYSLRPRVGATRAFSLIELLVSISVIALLLSILLPSLSRARHRAKIAVCASNLSQIGLAILTYANDQHGVIPRGPDCTGPFDFACADVATNQLWIGTDNPFHAAGFHGFGPLMQEHVEARRVFFCPADDSRNLEEELPRIGTELDAFGSYTYRQLDCLPAGKRRGTLSNLGANLVDGQRVSVEALALDTNSLGPEAQDLCHTNHGAKIANVLYRDRSVKTFANREGTFSIPAEAFLSPMDIFTRLDQIFVNADFGHRGSPEAAPTLDAEG